MTLPITTIYPHSQRSRGSPLGSNLGSNHLSRLDRRVTPPNSGFHIPFFLRSKGSQRFHKVITVTTTMNYKVALVNGRRGCNPPLHSWAWYIQPSWTLILIYIHSKVQYYVYSYRVKEVCIAQVLWIDWINTQCTLWVLLQFCRNTFIYTVKA